MKIFSYQILFLMVWAGYSVCHADWATNRVGNALNISKIYPDGTAEIRTLYEDPISLDGRELSFNEADKNFLDLLRTANSKQRHIFFLNIAKFGTKLSGSEILGTVLKMYPAETDILVKKSMLNLMGSSHDPKCKAVFLEAAKSDESSLRLTGAVNLLFWEDMLGVNLLIEMLPFLDRKDQISAITTLNLAIQRFGLVAKLDEKAFEEKTSTEDEVIAAYIQQWQDWWSKNKSKYEK